MTKSTHFISWLFQFCIIALLAPAAYYKLTSSPSSVGLFTSLGMEPIGRYVIGFLEAIACLLLIIPQAVIHGALLSLCLMMGAAIAHITRLGFSETTSYSPILMIILSGLIIYLRRSQIRSIARMAH